jgi:hypothetical protein
MKSSTSFDLNCTVRQWRENLSQSPAFHRESLDELEVHLRDSIASFQSQGFTAEDSFLVSIQRIGTAKTLEMEFAKVNRNPTNALGCSERSRILKKNINRKVRIATILIIALLAWLSSPKAITQMIVFVTLFAVAFGVFSLTKKLRAVKC